MTLETLYLLPGFFLTLLVYRFRAEATTAAVVSAVFGAVAVPIIALVLHKDADWGFKVWGLWTGAAAGALALIHFLFGKDHEA